MKWFALSSPDNYPDEAARFKSLIQKGTTAIYLRKPTLSQSIYEKYITSFPLPIRSKLLVHAPVEQALEWGVWGIHFRAKEEPKRIQTIGKLHSTKACHTLNELAQYSERVDYLFLSPLFDSLSKPNYRSDFSDNELRAATTTGTINSRSIALGGITPEKVDLCREYGFGGVAFLGYLWQKNSEGSWDKRIETIKKKCQEK